MSPIQKQWGAMALAEERGINVPGDLMFVSIDNTIADRCEKPLSAVALRSMRWAGRLRSWRSPASASSPPPPLCRACFSRCVCNRIW